MLWRRSTAGLLLMLCRKSKVGFTSAVFLLSVSILRRSLGAVVPAAVAAGLSPSVFLGVSCWPRLGAVGPASGAATSTMVRL